MRKGLVDRQPTHNQVPRPRSLARILWRPDSDWRCTFTTSSQRGAQVLYRGPEYLVVLYGWGETAWDRQACAPLHIVEQTDEALLIHVLGFLISSRESIC